ncbi:MAG: hypothetical protein H8E71_00105 [Candidatus Marinimicrobia bacterium]|nr:hypothetical protein [Candidatus Neomarinimicrobiota bacterium]
MKIIFDTNVWRQITLPDYFPNDPSIDSLRQIRESILHGKIEPYISETVFTIESIKRIERKKFISNYIPRIVFTEKNSNETTSVSTSKNIHSSQHPSNHPILQEHLDAAIELGIRIVRYPRLAGIINPDIENLRFKLTGDSLKDYHTKLFAVGEQIELREAGFKHIQTIGKNFDSNWLKGIEKAPEDEWGNIAKAVAEWADGDSVAISIALGCNYFCTRDLAKGAGNKSVLSHDNLTWLNNDYGFETILPKDLAKLI